MASCTQTSKAVSDIEDCVAELGKCFLTTKLPINDDNITLHRLQEKLEFILLLGLKEKPGVFGVKRTYWDYITACYSSSKRPHQGLKFVKNNLELKTSIGHGRAFIRFCLMQKSLADTLQTCFIDKKTTRDFYTERSLPLQSKLLSPFITSLYELNEINFDLNPQYSELDASWPSFARKMFLSSENEALHCRSFSSHLGSSLISNCTSDVSFEDGAEKISPMEEGLKETHLVKANSMLEANVLYLQKKCENLEKEISYHVQEENIDPAIEEVSKDMEDIKSITHDTPTNEDFKRTNNNYYCDGNSLNKDDAFVKNINTELNLNFETDAKCECNLMTDSSKANHGCSEIEIPNIKCLPKMYSDNKEESPLGDLMDMPKLLNNSNTSISSASSDKPSQLTSTVEAAAPGLEVTINGIDCLDFNDSNCTNFLSCNQTSPLNNEDSDSLNVLFFRTKGLIDNLRNSIEKSPEDPLFASNLKDLKNNWDSFENRLFTEIKRVKDFHVQKKEFEKYAYCIKFLALKQETLIDALVKKMISSVKENESLYDKICFLKDKLHSYGLLKIQTEHNFIPQNLSTPINDSSSSLHSNAREEDGCAFQPCNYISNDCFQSLQILKTSSSKLYALNTQATALQSWLESSHKLNNNLISRVQDQEMHMKGITKELEEAHHLLSVMRKQHQKLQSAESIVKYDLQEKRKLLTKLKHQLETTREDCNIVRLKNSKSEVEWQNLRKEFVQRHKQTSEESGFVDDRGIEDQSCSPLNSVCENNLTINDSLDEVKLDECSGEIKSEVKKSRLELLEEQCKILCTNLLHSSKKRQELDSHLESLCKVIKVPGIEKVTPEEKLTETCNLDDDSKICLDEVACENVDSNSEANCSLSSEIESLNSDCCSFDPLTSTALSKDISASVDSLKNDSTILTNDIDMQHCQNNSFFDDIHFVVDSVPKTKQMFNSTSPGTIENAKETSYACVAESREELVDSHSKELRMTEKNILVISENYPTESPMQVEFLEMHLDEKENSHLDCDSKNLSNLQEEKRILQSRLQELEKQNLLISSKLNQQTLIEAAKEHEITALQFQLNSQTLNYEKALQEFSENNDGLKDMKQKVNDQEQLILTLEEALTEIQIARENEKEQQWEQLEDFKRFSLKDRESMESEISNLQNYSKELQKKVIKLLKQKDILWKMNDQLTFVQKIKIDDRWMADHEVSVCLGCKSNFSFILRKHHCRHCGRIFCYSCSNNWLLTPSSRKKIRICNECYMQHLEMKKVVRRDSNPPYFDDESDNEDLADMPVDLNWNSSINYENHSSMADSIVSLPILQINNLQQKSHFSSAPDLHLFFENKEDPEKSSPLNHPISICDVEAAKKSINGDLVIEGREEAILPILCEGDTSELHWSFYPYEAIPISLIYENTTHSDVQTVLLQSACEVESVIHLSLPGLYNFHFDNRSRTTSITVHYSLKMKITKEEGVYR